MNSLPFDKRSGKIWFDGDMVAWKKANIHVLTHGLHYASAVFEGCRAYHGRIFRLNDHSQRLLNSAKILNMHVDYTVEDINDACMQAVAANKIEDGYIRPIIWRGAEGMGIAAPNAKPHVAVAAWTWPDYFDEAAQKSGLALKTAEWRRPPPYCAPTKAKAASLYTIGTMSKMNAEKDGYHDALVLDWRGRVTEATAANIFFVFNGELHTTVPDCFLNGLTRQTVMDIARDMDINVVERIIMPDEIEHASEVFLTGTVVEVIPVGKIDNMNFSVGPVTTRLRDAYAKLVRQG